MCGLRSPAFYRSRRHALVGRRAGRPLHRPSTASSSSCLNRRYWFTGCRCATILPARSQLRSVFGETPRYSAASEMRSIPQLGHAGGSPERRRSPPNLTKTMTGCKTVPPDGSHFTAVGSWAPRTSAATGVDISCKEPTCTCERRPAGLAWIASSTPTITTFMAPRTDDGHRPPPEEFEDTEDAPLRAGPGTAAAAPRAARGPPGQHRPQRRPGPDPRRWRRPGPVDHRRQPPQGDRRRTGLRLPRGRQGRALRPGEAAPWPVP